MLMSLVGGNLLLSVEWWTTKGKRYLKNKGINTELMIHFIRTGSVVTLAGRKVCKETDRVW